MLTKDAIIFLAIATFAEVSANDEVTRCQDDFKGKVLLVKLENRAETYTVADPLLRTIGNRLFLIGSKPVEGKRRQNDSQTVAIAWEQVEILTIFENLEAYRKRNDSSDTTDSRVEFKLPKEMEIQQLRDQSKELNKEIVHQMRLIAMTEIDIQKLREEASSESTDDEKRELIKRAFRHREVELQVYKKKMNELKSAKRKVEDRLHQIHREILDASSMD